MSILRLIAVAGLVAGLTGCSIMHPIADDYSQYLSNNRTAGLPTAKPGEQYYQLPATQSHRYEFRAATVGYAHVWVVEFGKVLDSTMKSADVVAALGTMSKASQDKAASGNTLVFDLQKYTFEDHGAHIELAISVRNAAGDVFSKVYKSDGQTQGSKMFFGGPFGMKNAVQQSTKHAMDDIMRRFINDLNASGKAQTSVAVGGQ